MAMYINWLSCYVAMVNKGINSLTVTHESWHVGPTFSDGHEILQLDTKTTPRRWPPKTETRVETESCLHQPRWHQDKKFKFRDKGETLLAFEVVIETSMQARWKPTPHTKALSR